MYPDIIINNAAGNFLCQSEKLTYNGWNSIIDTVLKGTVDMTLEFGKNMIRNEKNGVFLNISTTYANTGSAFVLPFRSRDLVSVLPNVNQASGHALQNN